MGKDDEVYYCGKCDRQQTPETGIKCRDCGGVTVSWFTDREKVADVRAKWKRITGK